MDGCKGKPTHLPKFLKIECLPSIYVRSDNETFNEKTQLHIPEMQAFKTFFLLISRTNIAFCNCEVLFI